MKITYLIQDIRAQSYWARDIFRSELKAAQHYKSYDEALAEISRILEFFYAAQLNIIKVHSSDKK